MAVAGALCCRGGRPLAMSKQLTRALSATLVLRPSAPLAIVRLPDGAIPSASMTCCTDDDQRYWASRSSMLSLTSSGALRCRAKTHGAVRFGA